MPRFFDPLLRMIAGASERELLAQLQFLKAENQILRERLPRRIRTTPVERARLLRLGEPLGLEIVRHLITVVNPDTFADWVRQSRKPRRSPKKRVGRPRTPDHICELVIRIADETGLGYTRIQGELRKLGVSLARTTIKNILKRENRTPDPRRGEGRWDEFLAMHAESLWACDFLSVRTWTLRGLRSMYLLLFIHIDSRRIFVTPATSAPTLGWTDGQARRFTVLLEEHGLECSHLIRDRDGKFGGGFDGILRDRGVEVVRLPRWSPNLNAFAERAIRSLKGECLSEFIILGREHLDHLVGEYAEFYNTCRPHSARGYLPPVRAGPIRTSGEILCEPRLGGLLKHYYRKAA